MGVVENMKDVADLIKKIGDIELNRKILTLENEVLDLSREKRRLENQVVSVGGPSVARSQSSSPNIARADRPGAPHLGASRMPIRQLSPCYHRPGHRVGARELEAKSCPPWRMWLDELPKQDFVVSTPEA
jgi:hypothetical protein